MVIQLVKYPLVVLLESPHFSSKDSSPFTVVVVFSSGKLGYKKV